jgi:DNA polymerase
MRCLAPCPVCPRRFAAISGDGPQPAQIMSIAERPGKEENRHQQVLVGPTGQEWNETYLPLARLRRNRIYATNAVKCWAEGNRTPTVKEIDGCAGHFLPGELSEVRPEIVILMGGAACSLAEGVNLELHHGRPRRSTLYQWSGWVVPMYHPAIGLHESRWMTTLLEDWERLGGWFKSGIDSWEQSKSNQPIDYKLVRDHQVFAGLMERRRIAVDTESHGRQPWSIQWSYRPGVARMVMAADEASVARFRQATRESEFIFHHSPADLVPLSKLSIYPRSYRDTMQEAFHLGNLPQGLKQLVYRLFDVEMSSWEDIVRPASLDALLAWCVEAIVIARSDLSLVEVRRLKTKIKETVKTGPLEQLLIRLIRNTDEESKYDPWSRLDEFWQEPAYEFMANHVEARIGRYPILGIGNCSEADAIRYACSDADWTGRVAAELSRRRSDAFQIVEGDEDRKGG